MQPGFKYLSKCPLLRHLSLVVTPYLGLILALIATGILLTTQKPVSQAATLTQATQWQPTNTVGAPSGRYGHTAIWTGREMILWGGYFADFAAEKEYFLNDGHCYYPNSDEWMTISTVNAPIGRLRHTAIWTGQEMIIWGGESGGGGVTTDTGGRYNLATNTWTPVSTVNAPSAREMHTAVWTGQEMIIWGGCSTVVCNQVFNDGGRYNPTTNTWTPIPTVVGLVPRNFHHAVWTGNSMIIWGGTSNAAGVSYDPGTNNWTPISTVNAPTPTFQGTAVWTGKELIVWGGCTTFSTTPCPTYVNTGGRYNPVTNTWTPVTTVGAPAARWKHNAVWTGKRMIVWGGCGVNCYNTGSSYDPESNTWENLDLKAAPSARSHHEAVWTGTEMVIWGGLTSSEWSSTSYLNTGGKYEPWFIACLPLLLKE